MNYKMLVPPEDRMSVLTAERNHKMAASVARLCAGHGTTRFYEWLEASRPIWRCPRARLDLRRLPCRKSRAGREYQRRAGDPDTRLDQTVIGNPAHDLIRLGLSLAMAARGSNLPGVTTAHMLEHMIDGYEAAFAGGGGERTVRGHAEEPSAP